MEHEDLLDNVVKATANIFKRSKIATQAVKDFERMNQRDNAVSPLKTKGTTIPDR